MNFQFQICNNGRCIVENENAIPDYSEDLGLNSFLKRTDTILAATEAKPFYSGGIGSTSQVYNPTTTKPTTTTTRATTTTTRATTTTITTTPKPLITTVPWWHTSSKVSTPSTRYWVLTSGKRSKQLLMKAFCFSFRSDILGGTTGPRDQLRRRLTHK